MTRSVTSPDQQFSIVLPGTWAFIPLDPPELTKRRIAALVKKQVGMQDRLARHRRDVREQLFDTARRAAAQGAFAFALSLELLPGVPFPSAMIAIRRPWVGAAGAPELQAAFPTYEMLQQRTGPVARLAETEVKRFGDEESPSLSLEYRLPTPRGDELLALTFSAPMVRESALFTGLFDAMVDSITFTDTDTDTDTP